MPLIARDVLLTPAKAAARIGIDVRTLQYELDQGRVPFERLTERGMRRIRTSTADALKRRLEANGSRAVAS